MQTTTEPIDGNSAQKGEVLLHQVTLSRARELAKAEEYDTALVLLLQMEQTTAALDLRARIELQRGRYGEARELWTEVLEEAPEHPGAKKGLRDVQRAASLKKIVRGFAAGAVILAAAGTAALAFGPSEDAPAAAKDAPAPAAVQAAPAARPSVAAPAPQPTAAAPAKAAAPATVLPQLAVPEGVSLRLHEGSQLYSFDGGLFVEGTAFVPGGREKVTALARALAPYTESHQIELIGHVDTTPAPIEKQFHGNTELALARANAVLGRIARTSRIPADDITLRAVGGRLGPHAAEQGDARNRTVDVRVSPRAR